jgi:hypothetical protein
MGFQIPSAARPGGLIASFREEGPAKTVIDSLALRVVGGLFEYSDSPRATEVQAEPPHEVALFITRPVTMEMGGQTMVGEHGKFTLHGPTLMAGKIDPSTNFSYPTNRQVLEDTELVVER